MSGVLSDNLGRSSGLIKAVAAPASGFTQGTEVASTSGTTVAFSSIPAGIDMIVVGFNGVSTNGTSGFRLRIGDAGGIETSGYESGIGRIYIDGANTTNGGRHTAGFGILQTLTAAGDTVHGQIILTLEDSSNFTWVAQGQLWDSGALDYINNSCGSKTLSAELTQLDVTTVSGDTFDAGAINIMYQ